MAVNCVYYGTFTTFFICDFELREFIFFFLMSDIVLDIKCFIAFWIIVCSLKNYFPPFSNWIIFFYRFDLYVKGNHLCSILCTSLSINIEGILSFVILLLYWHPADHYRVERTIRKWSIFTFRQETSYKISRIWPSIHDVILKTRKTTYLSMQWVVIFSILWLFDQWNLRKNADVKQISFGLHLVCNSL